MFAFSFVIVIKGDQYQLVRVGNMYIGGKTTFHIKQLAI